jgi:hypothetical protein
MYQYIMYIIQFVKILACVAISVAIRVGVLKQRNWFGDQRALLQGIIDALNAVLFHLQEKARRHLRLRCARIEESRCGMCEELPGHQVIGLHSRCHIAAVDATGCAHDEVLWPFHTLSVHTEKIRLLQGFETKVVVPKVTWRQRVTRCHFSSESQHVAKKTRRCSGYNMSQQEPIVQVYYKRRQMNYKSDNHQEWLYWVHSLVEIRTVSWSWDPRQRGVTSWT